MKRASAVRLSPGEDILFFMRTHPKCLAGPVAVLMLLSGCAIATALYLPSDAYEGGLYPGIMTGLGMLAIFYSWWPTVRWRNTTYTVTNRQIIVNEGVLYRKSHSTQLNRVSDIEVERGILDRIFRCGSLIVVNAANIQGGPSDKMNRVILKDVPRALDVEQLIKDLVFASQTGAPA